MTCEQITTIINGWRIVEYVSNVDGHRRGWLINEKSGYKYVWNCGEKGIVRYMRQALPPKNIPRYITEEIKNGGK